MNDLLHICFLLAHQLIRAIQPILVPLCFVVAWVTFGLGAWGLWAAVRDSVRRAQQMHRIPCADCQYFSGNYLLKCPLHPKEALSEAAIDCRDFAAGGVDWPLPDPLSSSPR